MRFEKEQPPDVEKMLGRDTCEAAIVCLSIVTTGQEIS